MFIYKIRSKGGYNQFCVFEILFTSYSQYRLLLESPVFIRLCVLCPHPASGISGKAVDTKLNTLPSKEDTLYVKARNICICNSGGDEKSWPIPQFAAFSSQSTFYNQAIPVIIIVYLNFRDYSRSDLTVNFSGRLYI